ncbi:MAG: tetratricopeptide repeat protein [Planctomycetes bacterium]|nr:tetratricopeptide repeat protein [Planctomycetota bacterium]
MNKLACMATAIPLVLLIGCGQPEMQDSKAEAFQRWNQTRSHMLASVGVEQLRSGQLNEAARSATDALALDSENAQARLLLGNVLIEQGHYLPAESALLKAVEQLPADPQAAYLLGVAQEKAGKLEAALASYKLSYVKDNRNLDAVMAAAEVLVALGRSAEAAAYIEAYLPLAQTDSGLHEVSARLAMMRGDYVKAVEDYQHASDIDSRNVRYREEMGRAQYQAGMYAQALETFNLLMSDHSYEPPAWMLTLAGDCLMIGGRAGDALCMYQQVCQLQVESAGAWCNVAKAALSAGDEQRAAISARQALSIDPSCIEATLVLAYAMIRQDDAPGAVEILSAACRAHPDSAVLQIVLGRALANCGRMNDAAQCYQIALNIEPQNNLARELLALSSHQSRR